MKKLAGIAVWLSLSMVSFASSTPSSVSTVVPKALATTPKPLQNCEHFLRDPLVEDQLYEIFGEGSKFEIKFNAQEDYCTLQVITEDEIDYDFSSENPSNFVKENKEAALYLYEEADPSLENVIEADLDDEGEIIDVGYDFPIVDGVPEGNQENKIDTKISPANSTQSKPEEKISSHSGSVGIIEKKG